jgi:hypothetical protein
VRCGADPEPRPDGRRLPGTGAGGGWRVAGGRPGGRRPQGGPGGRSLLGGPSSGRAAPGGSLIARAFDFRSKGVQDRGQAGEWPDIRGRSGMGGPGRGGRVPAPTLGVPRVVCAGGRRACDPSWRRTGTGRPERTGSAGGGAAGESVQRRGVSRGRPSPLRVAAAYSLRGSHLTCRGLETVTGGMSIGVRGLADTSYLVMSGPFSASLSRVIVFYRRFL